MHSGTNYGEWIAKCQPWGDYMVPGFQLRNRKTVAPWRHESRRQRNRVSTKFRLALTIFPPYNVPLLSYFTNALLPDLLLAMKTQIFSSLLLVLLGRFDSMQAQMINPSIDRPDEPFCYFSKPTDEIGVMDGKSATLISPEGYLYTGFGEMMFFTGNPLEAVNQRVKKLHDGYLPIVEYRYHYEGFEYHLQTFAATMDGDPESPLINFVRVTITNEKPVRRNAFFSAGIRYQNDVNTTYGKGDNRFRRPAKSKRPGGYNQPGVEFNPAWKYGFGKGVFLRDGKVMYLFPTSPEPELRMTVKDGEDDPVDTTTRALNILPTTPAGVTVYKLPLGKNEKRSLDFLMPVEPISPDSPLLDQLRGAKFNEYLEKTVTMWQNLFEQGMEIWLPEKKVSDAFKANLVYDLIARNKVDSFYVQTVNDFHYHAFWLRDASYIVNMYELTGYQWIARQCLDYFAQFQQPDGNFVSQPGQFDGWGQTLWAYGQHYRYTHDRTFALSVLPSIERAMAWLDSARKSDPLHLIPVTAPGDNEDINGHITGHNFNALGGIRSAITIAGAAGRKDLVTQWGAVYSDFLRTFTAMLHQVTASTGGYIPPGLDKPGGQDWGNMESISPAEILDPNDPMVTATLNATRAKYQEGIMTYGDGRWLHDYLTMSNTETEVIRGEQQTALEEFYALLVHTSATHAGFEYDIRPWKTRDFGGNLSPHGWFAAKFRSLLRNMLIREEGDQLHLLSVVSPEWMKNRDTIAVRGAPTAFGTVNMVLIAGQNAATLYLTNEFTSPPKPLILHLPWFLHLSDIIADGRKISISNGLAILPVNARIVHLTWPQGKNREAMSYDRAVRAYKEEYAKRWRNFIEGD